MTTAPDQPPRTRETVEAAASFLVGADVSSTRAGTDRPRLVLADGPSGLAMNLPDFSGKVPATSFPAPVGLASTWNVDLIEEVGAAIGTEAHAAGAHVLLGPSINLKRSPLGGRNFEYYSEDPHLSGHLGAAFVRGVQSQGVGACVKHFAVNSQETDRMRVSAEVSERALRELYLAAFEHIVTEAEPTMVMASYNRVNGIYAAQHPWLLTQVLREEWGFRGATVSDWGAVDDPALAVAAGLDLQMPGPAPAARDAIVAAVTDGRLDHAAVHEAAERLAGIARRWGHDHSPDDLDLHGHGALARRAATESFVLLRNEAATLPLQGAGRLLVVGELARTPRREGGGSAEVASDSADNFLDALQGSWAGTLTFDPGYRLDEDTQPPTTDSVVDAARAADAVVLVVGTPPGSDSEGYDRDTLDLPADQVAVIEAVAATGTPVTVVINAGGIVTMTPWHERVGAVLAAWLPGGAGGAALADTLLGVTSPSGKLAETVPLALEDTPAWPGFPATDQQALHAEGVLIGYRWYDRAGKEVAYPFGHGLSYTTFGYSDLVVHASDGGHVDLTFRLTNTGTRPGAEAWQVYIADPDPAPADAARRLAAFGKTALDAGESRTVDVSLRPRDFAGWDAPEKRWRVREGRHIVEVGASSRDIRHQMDVRMDGEPDRTALSPRSTLRDWMRHPAVGPRLRTLAAEADPNGTTVAFLTNPMVLTMIGDMPIHRLLDDPSNVLSSTLLAKAVRCEHP